MWRSCRAVVRRQSQSRVRFIFSLIVPTFSYVTLQHNRNVANFSCGSAAWLLSLEFAKNDHGKSGGDVHRGGVAYMQLGKKEKPACSDAATVSFSTRIVYPRGWARQHYSTGVFRGQHLPSSLFFSSPRGFEARDRTRTITTTSVRKSRDEDNEKNCLKNSGEITPGRGFPYHSDTKRKADNVASLVLSFSFSLPPTNGRKRSALCKGNDHDSRAITAEHATHDEERQKGQDPLVAFPDTGEGRVHRPTGSFFSVDTDTIAGTTEEVKKDNGEVPEKGDKGEGNAKLDCTPTVCEASSDCLRSRISSNREIGDSHVPFFPRETEPIIHYIQQGVTQYKWIDSPAYETQVLWIGPKDSLKKQFRKLGMPEGFPSSVAPDYQSFFYYSLIGAGVSNFSSAIGFQCLLSGFFLSSTPQLWVLKDLFPALLATYLANNVVSYENKPKRWYFMSTLLYNFTSISDIFISSLSADFMVAASVCSSVMKQSSALMFLVTRSCALQHFAIGNNLGELTKKLNSYSMVVYTLASAAGTAFCYFVPNFYIKLSVAIGCLVFNQTFMTKLILSSIHYRILNLTTMTLLVDYYNQQKHVSTGVGEGKKVLSPKEVSRALGIFEVLPKNLRGVSQLLCISPPLKKLIIQGSTLYKDVLFTSVSRSFLIGLFPASRFPLTWRQCFKRRELPDRIKAFNKRISFLSPSRFLDFIQCLASGKRKPLKGLKDIFGGKQLTLLVQVGCPAEDVVFANYLLLTAILQHGESEESVRSFLRNCEKEEEKWRREADNLRGLLKGAGWDVVCPMLDHPDFRLKSLQPLSPSFPTLSSSPRPLS